MKSRDFCYWLQGFFELQRSGTTLELNAEQTEMVRRHLSLVFKHEIDPSTDLGNPFTKAELQALHDGVTFPNKPIGGAPLVRC